MARGREKAKPVDARIAPTREQQTHAEYLSAGMKYQRISAIDSLLTRKQITDREYVALAFYRDQAGLAEQSPVKSCLDQRVPGQGDIPVSAAITSAILTTARIERDLGSLRDIARAVAVDDKSLSGWCIDKFGGRERYDGKGKFVAVVPVNEKRHVEMARMELRMAAHRITT